MIDPQLVAFTAVAAGVIVSPGADFAVVTRNALHSCRSGVATAAGVTCGLILHTTMAILGLTAALVALPTLYRGIQIIGGIYLLYLGARALLSALGIRPGSTEISRISAPSDGAPRAALGTAQSLGQGFLTDALNPKSIVLFWSLLPQFALDRQPHMLRTTLMGGIIIVLGCAWFLTITMLLNRLGRWLRQPRVLRILDGCMGTMLTAFGTTTLLGRA